MRDMRDICATACATYARQLNSLGFQIEARFHAGFDARHHARHHVPGNFRDTLLPGEGPPAAFGARRLPPGGAP
jgi:hypothetical protein